MRCLLALTVLLAGCNYGPYKAEIQALEMKAQAQAAQMKHLQMENEELRKSNAELKAQVEQLKSQADAE